MDVSRETQRLVVWAVAVLAGSIAFLALSCDASACVTPEQHGAVADDGLDDRVALQAAINAAAGDCLELGLGTYHVSRRPELGAAGVPSLKVTAPTTITGTGPGSVISMLGSGIRPGQQAPGDWVLLSVAAPATLRDIALDGGERFDTGEQTHLMSVDVGSTDVLIERLEFNLPNIGGSGTGGDCLRILGSVATWVSRVSIVDSLGYECDRSFVLVQRGTEDISIFRNTTVRVGDQVVDFEPTGGSNFPAGVPITRRVSIIDNQFRRSLPGDTAISICGDGDHVAEDVTLRGGSIEGGGVFLCDVRDVWIEGLHFKSPGPEPTIKLIKRAERVVIVNTILERMPGATTNQTVKLTGQAGAQPTDVTLLNVTIRHWTDGVPIYGEGLRQLTIAGSRIEYHGAATASCGIKLRGISTVVGRPVVVDTALTGSLGCVAEVAGLNEGAPVVVRSALN